ncbi:AMP-binding protein [Chloroflexota bacterium]
MARATWHLEEMADEYLSKGYWTGETTVELWNRNAELCGDKEALVDSRNRLTWRQAKEQSDSLALSLLDMGFQRDELVYILLPNCIESYLIRLACEKAGILCLTSLMGLRESEIEYILKNFGVAGLVIIPHFRNFNYLQVIRGMRSRLPELRHVFSIGEITSADTVSIDEIAQRPAAQLHRLDKKGFKPDEVAIAALTSGTTGIPKVAEHVVAARIALGDSYHRRVQLTSDDIILNVISAVAGLGAPVCYSSVREAAKTIALEIWNATQALKLIEEERATVMLCAPAQVAMLVQDPDFDKYDTSSLRAVFCGTSPLTREIATAAEDKLKVPVLNAYGSFDGGGISTTGVDDDKETRWLTAGKPHWGNQVKIVGSNGKEAAPGEEGELRFKGPCSCGGYYKDIERTKEMWGTLGKEGWFSTGDVAKLDKNNNIILTGRQKEVIIRGGQNIYPAEIEGLLFLYPKIKHVAVVPMPDPIMGEKACAFVVPKEGEEFTFEEMLSYLKGKKIAPYKLPERLEIKSSLPLRDSQKVVKSELREEVTRKLKAEGKI